MYHLLFFLHLVCRNLQILMSWVALIALAKGSFGRLRGVTKIIDDTLS